MKTQEKELLDIALGNDFWILHPNQGYLQCGGNDPGDCGSPQVSGHYKFKTAEFQ